MSRDEPEPATAAHSLHSRGTEHTHDPQELAKQLAGLRAHAQEAARELGEIAERLAQTADDVARSYDRLAATRDPATAARARHHAERLRRFAEDERREHQRYATAAPTQPPAPPTLPRAGPATSEAPPGDLIRAWWNDLLPDEQAHTIAGRWEPLSPWLSQSLAAAGLPCAEAPGLPGAYLTVEIQDFLDRFGIPGSLATS